MPEIYECKKGKLRTCDDVWMERQAGKPTYLCCLNPSGAQSMTCQDKSKEKHLTRGKTD